MYIAAHGRAAAANFSDPAMLAAQGAGGARPSGALR